MVNLIQKIAKVVTCEGNSVLDKAQVKHVPSLVEIEIAAENLANLTIRSVGNFISNITVYAHDTMNASPRRYCVGSFLVGDNVPPRMVAKNGVVDESPAAAQAYSPQTPTEKPHCKEVSTETYCKQNPEKCPDLQKKIDSSSGKTALPVAHQHASLSPCVLRQTNAVVTNIHDAQVNIQCSYPTAMAVDVMDLSIQMMPKPASSSWTQSFFLILFAMIGAVIFMMKSVSVLKQSAEKGSAAYLPDSKRTKPIRPHTFSQMRLSLRGMN
jgi:hypothetical protein